jgi:competence protein ComFC
MNHLVIRGVSVSSYYDGPIKELILRLKFSRNRSAADVAAELILLRIERPDMIFDIVTSVPISAARYRERGYNQSELIARRVAYKLGLPYQPLLGRRNGEHQLGKDRKTRIEQVKNVFYSQKSCAGLRVLLIDDVVTTGATLDACARSLKGGGAKNVWGAVVAKH